MNSFLFTKFVIMQLLKTELASYSYIFVMLFQTNHYEPLRTTIPPSSIQTSKPPLPELHSTEDPDDMYEICDSTPFEKAAAVKKKRDPPPRPPPSYRHSHTHVMNTTKGHSSRKSSSDHDLKASLRDARMSSGMGTASQTSNPLAKKKPNVFHKPKTK